MAVDGAAPAKHPPVTFEQLQGFRQLERVAGLLSRLHNVGCRRDTAGNRELHFDEYVLLSLLYLFNPLIDSMRTLQQVAELPEVQKRLGIKRFSLGSFSEGAGQFWRGKMFCCRVKGVIRCSWRNNACFNQPQGSQRAFA